MKKSLYSPLIEVYLSLAILVFGQKTCAAIDCFTGYSTVTGLTKTQNCAQDTCKLTITYSAPTEAFYAFPKATLGCVQLSSETNEETGCKNCRSNSLDSSLYYYNYFFQGLSFFQFIPAGTCKLTSNDGLSTVYCSQKPYGNRPLVTSSCYVGAFSAETPLKPTACDKFLGDFCTTAWYTDANGVVSALGSCASHRNINGDYLDPSNDNWVEKNCIGNNCNNVLICYTGTYYQKSGHSGESFEKYDLDRKNTFKPSLCNYDVNQVCQTTVTYNALYGYAFQGKCKALGQCQNVNFDFTGDSNTVGTYCCTSQYCNSIKNVF